MLVPLQGLTNCANMASKGVINLIAWVAKIPPHYNFQFSGGGMSIVPETKQLASDRR